MNRAGTTNHSYLYHIFTLYTHASSPVLKEASYELLRGILASSILFEHDPDELGIWLSVLPSERASVVDGHGHEEGSGDGGGMKDVLEMLDECILRCLKTPYRYIEESLSIIRSSSSSSHSRPSASSSDAMDVDVDVDGDVRGDGEQGMRYRPEELPSPLLMTLLEQLSARSTKDLIAPTAIISIMTFIRQLAVLLVGKQPDLRLSRALHSRMSKIVDDMVAGHNDDGHDEEKREGWRKAVRIARRERDLLESVIQGIEKPIEAPLPPPSPQATEFFPLYERKAIGTSSSSPLLYVY